MVYFEADLLEKNIGDAWLVLEHGQSILRTINGYFRTVHPNWESLVVCGISRIEDDRPPTQFLLPMPVHVATIVLEPTLAVERECTPVSQDMAFLLDDADLSTVLRLFSAQPLDWTDMYRIFEVIQATDAPLLSALVSGKEQKRFMHTANSPAAIGEDARHGRQSAQPPRNPMSESDARSMIAKLVDAYSRKRQNSSHQRRARNP